MQLSEEQKQQLKALGLQRYEISHYVHNRYDKISKVKLKIIMSLVKPKRKYNNPIKIKNGKITVKCIILGKTKW